ncbi:MAG: tetratricopeptide repeat protein [Treponemataceae bacterium]
MSRRADRPLSVFAVLTASVLFGSCSGAFSRLTILEANFLARRGEHRQAVALYSRAAAELELEPYAAYDLGLVYLELGEIEPALGRFRFAAESVPADEVNGAERELAYRARFNAGVARYRAGNLESAAEEFKRALIRDGSRMAAKRNLELCLRGIDRRSVPASSLAQLGTKSSTAEPKSLFDYIREKESERWRSREWRADSANTPDY